MVAQPSSLSDGDFLNEPLFTLDPGVYLCRSAEVIQSSGAESSDMAFFGLCTNASSWGQIHLSYFISETGHAPVSFAFLGLVVQFPFVFARESWALNVYILKKACGRVTPRPYKKL